MAPPPSARPAPDRREIAQDLFRDHLDLVRLARAMALSRAERDTAPDRRPPPPRPAPRPEED